MANAYSTQDLVKGTLQRCGERTDGSSRFHELALKYVNTTYQAVLGGASEFNPDVTDAWTWARTQAQFNLTAFYNTGTVSLLNGSVNGTFSVAPTISQAGRFLKITNLPTFYQIATHTASTTSFTLKTAYLDPTGSALSFASIPLRYNLPGSILRLVSPFRLYADRRLEQGENTANKEEIFGIDIDTFRRDWPLSQLQNDTPSKFAVVQRGENQSQSPSLDNWVIQVNKYVTSDTLVDYEYIQIPNDLTDSDQDIPTIPREFRVILEFGACFFLLSDKEEEKKAMKYFELAKAKLTAMHQAEDKMISRTSLNYGKLIPRPDVNSVPWWLVSK